jgi:hypothetical protein
MATEEEVVVVEKVVMGIMEQALQLVVVQVERDLKEVKEELVVMGEVDQMFLVKVEMVDKGEQAARVEMEELEGTELPQAV